MSGWHILIRCAVCALGALVFLRFVADEVAFATDSLSVLEGRERKAYKVRQEMEMAPNPEIAEKAA